MEKPIPTFKYFRTNQISITINSMFLVYYNWIAVHQKYGGITRLAKYTFQSSKMKNE